MAPTCEAIGRLAAISAVLAGFAFTFPAVRLMLSDTRIHVSAAFVSTLVWALVPSGAYVS